jgi:hypothetical protein
MGGWISCSTSTICAGSKNHRQFNLVLTTEVLPQRARLRGFEDQICPVGDSFSSFRVIPPELRCDIT